MFSIIYVNDVPFFESLQVSVGTSVKPDDVVFFLFFCFFVFNSNK